MANHDYSDIEERFVNDARRQARSGKEKHLKRMGLFSTALEHKFDYSQEITADRLNTITKQSYKNPVVSLYLTMTPEHVLRDRKVYMTVFNSMLHEAMREEEPYISSLTHTQRQALKEDVAELNEFLEEHFYRDNVKTLIVFKSDRKLNMVIKLPVLLKDQLIIDGNPYTLPLQHALNTLKRYLVVQVSKDTTVLYRYYLGTLTELESVKSHVTSDRVDASRPNKVQRLRTAHLEDHLRRSGELLEAHARTEPYDCLLITSEEYDTAARFRQLLSKHLQQKLLDTIAIDPQKMGPQALIQAVESTTQDYERKSEREMKAQLAAAEGKGVLIEGIPQTIKAQNRFLVTDLYADVSYRHEGFACPSCEYLSIRDGVCQVCQKELRPVQNVIDELIEIARRRNVNLHLAEAEFMDKYGHVAALTY